MRQIIYLTENRALKVVDFDINGGNYVVFPERAFILSVIIDNNVLTSKLMGLSALEKYAMNANGFDFLILSDGDFRRENSGFYIPDDWETALPPSGNGGSSTPVATSSGGVSPLFPIYRNGLTASESVIVNYTSMGEVFNVSAEYPVMNYVRNLSFENTTVQVFGCIYFLSSHKMPENQYIYINPKTGEFGFYDYGEWTEVHLPQYTTWSVNKGYIRVFRHSAGNHIFLSTTPFDISIATVLPT